MDKAADDTLRASLPGHYYLKGVREVGAELLLLPDGRFRYATSYGAVDEFAQGTWTVVNQQVVFRSERAPAAAAALKLAAEPASPGVPAGRRLVDMRYRGKSIAGFKVAVLGDAPEKAEGRTGADGWLADFHWPVRQVAASHPEVNDGKWMVYAVAPADAQRGAYRFDFQPPANPGRGFDFTLDVRDGSLVLAGEGRQMEFQKQ